MFACNEFIGGLREVMERITVKQVLRLTNPDYIKYEIWNHMDYKRKIGLRSHYGINKQ